MRSYRYNVSRRRIDKRRNSRRLIALFFSKYMSHTYSIDFETSWFNLRVVGLFTHFSLFCRRCRPSSSSRTILHYHVLWWSRVYWCLAIDTNLENRTYCSMQQHIFHFVHKPTHASTLSALCALECNERKREKWIVPLPRSSCFDVKLHRTYTNVFDKCVAKFLLHIDKHTKRNAYSDSMGGFVLCVWVNVTMYEGQSVATFRQ